MPADFTAARKLQRSDVRDGFTNGANELDVWLIKYAWQNQQTNHLRQH